EDLGLAAELALDLAVGLPGGRSDGLQQRQHLAPLDVAAQRVAEDLLERDAMVVVGVLCHRAPPSYPRGPTRAAPRISLATTSGWEAGEAWLERTSTVVAPMRSAMNRSRS